VELDAPRQLILSGCPGSGKSYNLRERSAEDSGDHEVLRTTFHSETSYFDFIGSYRPSPLYRYPEDGQPLFHASGVESSSGEPLIDYRFVPGPFVRALMLALSNPTRKIVLIIEEINRANGAAVFGDMFQLLDRDATTRVSEYAIEPQPALKALLMEHQLWQDGGLRLPENLYLWATMNNADQGVQPLDSAFRRRWSFEYLGYLAPCGYDAATLRYGGSDVPWADFRAALNKKMLVTGLHEDRLIGPYFMTQEELGQPQSVLNKLFLYLWDDAMRYHRGSLSSTLRSFAEIDAAWSNGAGSPFGPLP
jgi:MoxR-like ATPase